MDNLGGGLGEGGVDGMLSITINASRNLIWGDNIFLCGKNTYLDSLERKKSQSP